jgi:hypothetical protein
VSSLRLALVLVVLAPVCVRADDLISADRPDLATGTSTVGRKTFQVEAGFSRDYDEEDARGLSTPFLLRYGLADAFELRVSGNGYRSFNSSVTDEETGWTPLSLGFKLRFLDGDTAPLGLAVIADVAPVSGSRDFRSDRTTADLTLAADKDLGTHWSLTTDVGVSWLDGGDRYGTYAAFVAAVTLQYNFHPSLGVFVDTYIQAPEVPENSPVEIYDVGAEWIVGRNTQLDAAVGWGHGGDSVPAWYWTAGVSRRF